jgi:hypothetical protein
MPEAPEYGASGVARGGIEPPTYRFSGGRSYQLSYLAGCAAESTDCAASARAASS